MLKNKEKKSYLVLQYECGNTHPPLRWIGRVPNAESARSDTKEHPHFIFLSAPRGVQGLVGAVLAWSLYAVNT